MLSGLELLPDLRRPGVVWTGSRHITQPFRSRHSARSKHIFLLTDVDRSDADRSLQQLEHELRVISRYWAAPLHSPLECYLVDDAEHWPPDLLPDPQAAIVLQRVGGYATSGPLPGHQHVRMYATTASSVAAHELVHAFCCMAFSRPPPAWYAEGMADYFAHATCRERGLQRSEPFLSALRRGPVRTVAEIVTNADFTQPIADSVHRLTGDGRPGDWLEQDERRLDDAKLSYSWAWALCHFLATNDNYSARFRQFGRQLREGHDASFDATFREDRWQLDAEFAHFVRHVFPGYQVERCRWLWPAQVREPHSWSAAEQLVRANRGWQSAGLQVAQHAEYNMTAEGSWRTSASTATCGAAGDADGSGRLVPGVLTSEGVTELEFSADGNFIAPHDGILFLRCAEDGDRLADNDGALRVLVRRESRLSPKESKPESAAVP